MISTMDINDEGWVTGGTTESLGLSINWQDGPLQDGWKANGATIEDVIEAAIGRLESFQNNGHSENAYNAQALVYLRNALSTLHERTKDRQRRGVEGKYER
jgi:hypothetical protein